MERLLTVLVQTSPVPSHPSTALLEALFRSFDRVEGLRECRIVILCDGCDEVPAEEEGYKRGKVSADAADRYRKHLELLRSRLGQAPFLSPMGNSLEMLELPERHGSARAIAEAFRSNKVRTPFVMIAQHDNFFVADVPLRSVLDAIKKQPQVKCVHFLSTATIDYKRKIRLRYGLELESKQVEGLDWPLVPLAFWYGRTHVAQTDYYENFVLRRPLRTGDHLEELLGQTQLEDMVRRSPRVAHDLYGNYVLDQGREVLYHLSGRRARAATENDAGRDGTCNSDQKECNFCQARQENDYKGAPLSPSIMPASTLYQNCGRSYTSARSSRAVVPGLELPRANKNASSLPQGHFRQKCFHCGVKGHSYKWCPEIGNTPEMETIDLS